MSQFTLPIIDCVVAERVVVADDVVMLTLEPEVRRPMPAWRPGAHLDFVLPIGIERHYSLCGDPGDRRRWRIAVLREPESRGGSAYVHESLLPGTHIKVRGPRNNFALEAAPCYRFVVGGIGITPILPMIRQVAAQDDPPDWAMLYGGRTRSSMAFLEDLDRHGPQVLVRPQDEFGLLDLAQFLGDAPAGTAVYACGPEPLLAAVESYCAEAALELHVERFKAQGIDESPNRPFTVELAQTGQLVDVTADQTMLEAVRRAGAVVLSSCEEGTCGTCETVLLDGEADHRDSILTPTEREAGDLIYVCVSRARSDRLVLDL